MKKLLFVLAAGFSMAAAAEYRTVTVCDGGESGTVCREVTYKVRAESPVEMVECRIARGEAAYEPCPTKVGVPRWLKELGESFNKGGHEAPVPRDETNNGGPN